MSYKNELRECIEMSYIIIGIDYDKLLLVPRDESKDPLKIYYSEEREKYTLGDDGASIGDFKGFCDYYINQPKYYELTYNDERITPENRNHYKL